MSLFLTSCGYDYYQYGYLCTTNKIAMSINPKNLAATITSFIESTNEVTKKDNALPWEFIEEYNISNRLKTITIEDLFMLDEFMQTDFYSHIRVGIEEDLSCIPKMINFLGNSKIIHSKNTKYDGLNLYTTEMEYLRSIIHMSGTLCDMFRIIIKSQSRKVKDNEQPVIMQDEMYDLVGASNYMAYKLINNPVEYFEWRDNVTAKIA